jgi:Major Facilitator Superfamily
MQYRILQRPLSAESLVVSLANLCLLLSTIFTPLYGQVANVFGRRWPAISGVAIFVLGSGISGGATSTATLIVGRLIQGIGGAGIQAMTNIIVSDLVPVRERGRYLGIIFAVFGVGIAIGPPIGGAIAQHGKWRWIFWLNLPLGGLAIALPLLFLHIETPKVIKLQEKVRQIDWVGNLLLVGSIVAILIPLSWADTRYPWSSWRIFVPLAIGFIAMIVFHGFEATRFCNNPTIPSRLFGNRTSAITLANTFLSSMLTFWRIYFLPLYFQGVLLASPGRSGVLLLPSVLLGAPASVIAGVALSKWGRYKFIHLFGYTLMTLATGLYINLGESSSLAQVVIYQAISGVGGGVLLSTFLPAVQAAWPQSDSAVVSATWGYLRTFGSIWGAAVPAAIFNSRFMYYAEGISDVDIRNKLGGGNAYAHVSSSYLRSLPDSVRQEVIGAYLSTMKNLWEVCLGFCVFSLLLTFAEKDITMSTTLNSDHMLNDVQVGKKDDDVESGELNTASDSSQPKIEVVE